MKLLNRIISALIDIAFSGIIAIPFISILSFVNLNDNMIIQVTMFSLVYSVFICKDLIFSGRSIGKRIIKLDILNQDHTRPSMIKLIFRNIFSFIWPLEFLVCLINPEKKIEDILFHTKVVCFNYIEIEKFKKTNIFILFMIVLFINTILSYHILNLLSQHSKLINLLYST